MKINFFYYLLLAFFIILGCRKEVSFEVGNKPSDGSLQSEISGDCLPKTVSGIYEAGKLLVAATNTIKIDVNVAQTGTYIISTDTINGYFFRATGSFTNTGNNPVTLKGTGTPFSAGVNNFVVSYDSTNCNVQVTVFPAGAGGPAAFTLSGGPGACAGATVNGTYIKGLALTTNNNVIINVNVTTIGAYNIATTFQGMTFSASGVFSATGPAIVTLAGTGTPTTTGINTVPITAGASTCSFVVNCLPPLSNDYFPRTTNSNWSYEYGDNVNDTLYRKAIATTISAAGNIFNIFMQNPGTGLDSSGYYRRNTITGEYYEWFDAGDFLGYNNPVWAEYIMLKDNVAVSTNWKSNGFSGTVGTTPISVRFSYTILQKNVPITITTSKGTATYQNVIVVEEKIEGEITPGVWQDITAAIDYYGKSYYAKGIGLIKFEAYNNANVVTNKQELRRFEVY